MAALSLGSAEYRAMHSLVRKERGIATLQQCVSCTNTAREWSWIHNSDPLDVMNYRPMCNSCHKKYDIALVDTSKWKSLKNAAKLDKEDIPEIRQMVASGRSQADVAYVFGVDKGVISKIIRGLIWKDA